MPAPAFTPGQPLLCLTGPTACGKTGAAIALAHALAPRWRVEVISVDSALIYRGMDIGTAKPSLTEREGIPHHLIDILEPHQSYSAAQFAQDARRLITEIHGRGGLPLLVGGTMLYVKALFEGLDALPAADPALREAMAAELQAKGIEALHRELTQVDAPTAKRLPPTDTQRILRALEVYRLTGQPLSSLHRQSDAAQPGLAGVPMLSLEPTERAWLHERVHRRFELMLAQGFLDEMRQLRQNPLLHPELPAMRCVGYRQAWEALDHDAAAPDPAWVERAVAATRQLAKRQITWLRSMPHRQVVACDHPGVHEAVRQWAVQTLESHPGPAAMSSAPPARQV